MEDSSPEEGVEVEVWLLSEGFDRDRIEGGATIVLLDVVSACVLASKVGLQSRSEDSEVLGES